jgi:hypothetical protein
MVVHYYRYNRCKESSLLIANVHPHFHRIKRRFLMLQSSAIRDDCFKDRQAA